MIERFTCFYPIFSLPPSVFHFNTALILSRTEGIGNVVVIIPNIKYDYLDQDQSAQLFEFYETAHPLIDIKVEKSPYENPFQDIKEKFNKDKNLKAFVALDEKTARSRIFNDTFASHDNLQIELVPSNFEKTSKKLRDAIETGNRNEFLKYVPENITQEKKEECWNIVHSEIEESIIRRDFWKNILSENLDQFDNI